MGDLVGCIAEVSDADVEALVAEYFNLYLVPDRGEAAMRSIREAARQELGFRAFLKATGARALTIHGRTLEHFYSGEVAAAIIGAVREALPGTPVIANGGVNSPESWAALRAASGCSRIMLAQGAMGNPWLFREIAGGAPPSLAEWREVVLEHIDGMIELYGETTAMKCARKIVHDYLRGRGFPGSLRAEASLLSRRGDLLALLERARPVSASAPRKFSANG